MAHPAIRNSESMHKDKTIPIRLNHIRVIPRQNDINVMGFAVDENHLLTIINDTSLSVSWVGDDVRVKKIIMANAIIPELHKNIAIIELERPHGLPIPELATNPIKRGSYVCFSNYKGHHRDCKVQSVLSLGKTLAVTTPGHKAENVGSPLFNRKKEAVGMMLNPKCSTGHAVFCGLPVLQAIKESLKT